MKKKKLKIGIIGCGVIGSAIAKYCVDELSKDVRLEALFDLDREKVENLKSILSKNITIAKSLDEIIKLSDLIVEAASKDMAPQALKNAIRAKKDIMIMSVGGIVERGDLLDLARKKNCRVYIPSGAISGLDGVKAAAIKKIDQAILTTKKPIEGLKDAPYIKENNIDLDSLKTDTLIFEGPASEAIRGFPKNVNVSATLSLAGIGIKDTKVRVICSPKSKRNIHEIELKGEFGNLFVRQENVPSPDNPKTSYLAVLSAIAALRGIIDSVRIGT